MAIFNSYVSLPEGKSQFYLANKWRLSHLTVEEKRETQPRVAGSSGRLADGVSFQLVWQLERMRQKKRVWNGYTLLLNLLSSHQSKFPQNRRNQRLISTMDWSKVVVVAEWTPFQPMKTSIDHIITFHLLIASNTLPDLIHQSTFLQYQQYYNTKHPEYIHDISWSVGGFKPHGPMNVLVIAPLSLSTLAGDPRVIRIKEPD